MWLSKKFNEFKISYFVLKTVLKNPQIMKTHQKHILSCSDKITYQVVLNTMSLMVKGHNYVVN